MQHQEENSAEGAEEAPDFAGVEGFVEEDRTSRKTHQTRTHKTHNLWR